MPKVPLTVLDLCRPDIKSLPIYNAGISESAARTKYSLARVTKLASNENPFGASPAALDALRHSVGQISRYPDPECTALREEIHRRTGVPAARILFGNGSENIIELLCQALLPPDDRDVTQSQFFCLHHTFPLISYPT